MLEGIHPCTKAVGGFRHTRRQCEALEIYLQVTENSLYEDVSKAESGRKLGNLGKSGLIR